MRLVVISSCTGKKKKYASSECPAPPVLSLEELSKSKNADNSILDTHASCLIPARELYTGKQHTLIVDGIEKARQKGVKIDFFILSAGYGLIEESKNILPYNVTFSPQKGVKFSIKDVKQRGKSLKIPEDIKKVLNNSQYDLAILLLGKYYLEVCKLRESTSCPTIVFVAEGSLRLVPDIERFIPLQIPKDAPTKFHCGNIGLKGELGARLLVLLAKEPEYLQTLLSKPKPEKVFRDLIDLER
jgi:Family of unknown function (DUF6884)